MRWQRDPESQFWLIHFLTIKKNVVWLPIEDAKGGFMSKDTGGFYIAKINIQNHYPEQKI